MSQTSPLTMADLPSFEGRWADMLDEEYQTPEKPRAWRPRARPCDVIETAPQPSQENPTSGPDADSWTVVQPRRHKATHCPQNTKKTLLADVRNSPRDVRLDMLLYFFTIMYNNVCNYERDAVPMGMTYHCVPSLEMDKSTTVLPGSL